MVKRIMAKLTNEPNQAEIDRQAAERLQQALAERRAAQAAAAERLRAAQRDAK